MAGEAWGAGLDRGVAGGRGAQGCSEVLRCAQRFSVVLSNSGQRRGHCRCDGAESAAAAAGGQWAVEMKESETILSWKGPQDH